MKIFDYKFIILLGLTLVVYFLYKELEFLRGKIDKIEQTVKTTELLPKLDESKPVLALPPKPASPVKSATDSLMLVNKSPKLITIDMTPTVANDSSQKASQKASPKGPHWVSPNVLRGVSPRVSPKVLHGVSPKVSEIEIPTLDNLSDKMHTDTTEVSNHIAIYSNDNEQFDETQNSLLESIESAKRKKELQTDIDCYHVEEPPMVNVETNIDDLIASLSISPKRDVTTSQYSETGLDKLKVNDLKKIADKKNITFSKKINGVQKNKTKKELIDEILASKI